MTKKLGILRIFYAFFHPFLKFVKFTLSIYGFCSTFGNNSLHLMHSMQPNDTDSYSSLLMYAYVNMMTALRKQQKSSSHEADTRTASCNTIWTSSGRDSSVNSGRSAKVSWYVWLFTLSSAQVKSCAGNPLTSCMLCCSHTTRLHSALSCAAVSIFLQLNLKPNVSAYPSPDLFSRWLLVVLCLGPVRKS